jgi:predicted amidohydrolase YtcJ
LVRGEGRAGRVWPARAALEGCTSQYWRSVGEAGGAIEPGARADLTVFADNPLATAPDAFANTPVLLTVVDGEVVFDNTNAAALATHA